MEGSSGDRSARTLIFQLLGVAAGLTAFVALVGGAILWARFEALELPADRAVALLPESVLLTVGAHALVGPLLVGGIVTLALSVSGALDGKGNPRSRLWITLGVLAAFLVVAVLFVYELDWWPEQATMYAGIVAAALAIVATAQAAKDFRPVGWVVFAVFAALGGLLNYVRTTGTPKLEPAAVLLKGDAGGLSGFLVGDTSDRLYIAPLPGEPFADAAITRVLELPRDEVARLALREPVGIGPRDAGREQAATLLQDLRLEQTRPGEAPPPEVVTAVDPVSTFAPLVHLHSNEFAWPLSADDFLANAALLWAHDDGCTDWVAAVDDHVAERGTRFAGRYGPLPLASGYEHRATDGDCADRGRAHTSAEHTRPYDRSGRAEGVPLEEGFYLDLRDDRRLGDPRIEKRGSQAVLQDVPIYAETQPAGPPSARGMRITYWLFYGLSRPPGGKLAGLFVHEGDWERISVLLAPGDGADQYVPTSVRYHFHDESRDVPWYAVRRALAEGDAVPTHPVAFSALGSHASYPRAGRYENVFKLGGRRRFAVFDDAIACSECPEWRTWESVIEARKQPWYGFGGAWGQVGSMGGTTGPLGPSSYKLGGMESVAEQTVDAAAAGLR